MRHAVVLTVLFAGTLSAAPVPKTLKEKVPPVAGTVWAGESDDEDLDSCVFTFAEDGTFTYRYTKKGDLTFEGFWELEGAVLTCRVKDSYATTTLTYTGGVFVGSGVNQQGETWKETLRPKKK